MEHLGQRLAAMEPITTSNAFKARGQDIPLSPRSYVSDWEAEEDVEARLMQFHLSLLTVQPEQRELGELMTTPIFNMPVLKYAAKLSLGKSPEAYPQYGLLAGMSDALNPIESSEDPRVFFNISEPSSTFICGSQGTGKSHTLSCLLENCLFASEANKLPTPLSGLVFHYDTFISDLGGSPCEAAFLASNPNIKVRVLCSPTNLRTAQGIYGPLGVEVESLRIREQDLNTKRMLDLMAVSSGDGPMPLYLHAIYRILRDMRLTQQETGAAFSYREFKRRVTETPMTPAQLGPLNQRLDTLESFMPRFEPAAFGRGGRGVMVASGTDWTNKSGCLTIVDLSCPCVTPEGACSLFNICLSIFIEQKTNDVGRIIALDEAHKYMNASAEANTLTSTLLSTIRLQRHLGARIVISTQEPTISPALLDLSSITIVHRFTSPEWLRSLRRHLAGAAFDLLEKAAAEHDEPNAIGVGLESTPMKIFSDIVKLKVGEALLFSPSAMVGQVNGEDGGIKVKRLGTGYLKIKVRGRLTTDGGQSQVAR